ncbi:response regulator receiver protein [Arthrobacter livingstonensis]|uniref:Response regulator receiver protein n=2 Tax=Arthrobacter livingstonensis TaxID=670078 RepID=A0A2V5LC45_9MICC|nr:response regulator receiver protein [Arthrobacter livingstonensis]
MRCAKNRGIGPPQRIQGDFMVEQQKKQGFRVPDRYRVRSGTTRRTEVGLIDEKTGEFLAELVTLGAECCYRPRSAVECGITVVQDGRPAMAAASGPNARVLEDLQYSSGTGPCVTALGLDGALLVQDLSMERRWPDYSAAASAINVRSILSVPLELGDTSHAVLNLYSEHSGYFTSSDAVTIASFAQIASEALKLNLVIAQLREQCDELKVAIISRTAADIAIGAIMAQHRYGREEPLKLLFGR